MGGGSSKTSKDYIRYRIWHKMEKAGVARPPFPIKGRIPNFVGAEKAASLLSQTLEFRRASIVFSNPDSPQKPVRELVLRHGKTLVMATPRLSKGFVVVEPRLLPRGKEAEASTIRGAFAYGRTIDPRQSPPVDLFIAGSVAVDVHGYRLGKGTGYSDLEHHLLKEVGAISEDTPKATTVHDVKVVPYVPRDSWDIPVDIIATPTKLIYAKRSVV